MREIRQSGLEGGGAEGLSLPLSVGAGRRVPFREDPPQIGRQHRSLIGQLHSEKFIRIRSPCSGDEFGRKLQVTPWNLRNLWDLWVTNSNLRELWDRRTKKWPDLASFSSDTA
jgi:hypothetical protein